MMGGLDDFLQPLVQLEERLVARARWGLLCDALPVLVERRWSLTPMPPKVDDEVPGRPAPASLQGLCTDDRGLVEDLFSDADVLENGITTLKAELVFAALAQKGEMDYRSFRQAMRQVAVALYPQLPEADALKLLGQKHVFPRVKLAPEKEASDLLPYQPESDSPRLLELLKREGGVVRDPAKRRASVETLRRAISNEVIHK